MSDPVLDPVSQVSSVILPSVGDTDNVMSSLSFGIYETDNFISGASDQVSYVYKKLGGDVLDIELTEGQVYNTYEEATLEYSYLINIHQGKNTLSNYLGGTTASFDQDGNVSDGDPEGVNLKYPKFDYGYARKLASALAQESGVGGSVVVHSASIDIVDGQQDYDLQEIISDDDDFTALVGDKKVLITKVYYKTPRAMWRFYGYYGGINTVGNMSTYGMYADDSTFQIIPSWQNKLQAMAYEDTLYTRLSHWSYELRNNKIRLFPIPYTSTVEKIWVEFTIPEDAWEEDSEMTEGVSGINNLNTLPFDNVPYSSINSIGKQWIRRFSLSLSKEMLGLVRSKFGSIPIPGNDVQLNGAELISQSKEEQEKLREELKEILDSMTYDKLIETDSTMVDSTRNIQEKIPLPIFAG